MSINKMPNLISDSSDEVEEGAITTKPSFHKRSSTSPIPCSPFPISHLPYELRQLIYKSYHLSAPPLLITPHNAFAELHTLSPLFLASPLLFSDISPAVFYRNTTFCFSSGSVLQTFSKTHNRNEAVRKIRILYGRDECPTRDWVYLMIECFEMLEEITFSVEGELEGWWGSVRDAVREGLLCSSQGNGRGKMNRRDVMLRVEDGEWSAFERLCK